MHELGVVFYIIDKVKEVAIENQVDKVSRVRIQLGEVSTVIPYYLNDAWVWARKKEDIISEAELDIEKIEALTFCDDCKKDYPTLQYKKICPYCGSSKTWLLQGSEFLIKEIEV